MNVSQRVNYNGATAEHLRPRFAPQKYLPVV
jgi:hypothetical protein